MPSQNDLDYFSNQFPTFMKQLTGTASKIQAASVRQEDVMSRLGELLEKITKTNEMLDPLLASGNMYYRLNKLTSNFLPLTIALTATPVSVFYADTDKVVVLLNRGVQAGNTLYLGNSTVNATTGFPLIDGDSMGPIMLERNTDIWAMSAGTSTLHILLF